MSSPALPFDRLAADYDRVFAAAAIGQRLRAATWRHIDAAFRPGDRVLELNCGTGEDAVHLGRRGVRALATDLSLPMLDLARAKVEQAGLAGTVEVEAMAIEALDTLPKQAFDGALSNFGGLNCVADMTAVAAALAAAVRPGGTVLLCIMGPAVPWEWGWFLLRGSPARAFRRWRRDGTPWRGLTIRYPSIGATRRAFAPHFRQRRVAAIGAFLPPTYAESWAARHPRLLDWLDRLERRLETLPPLPWLADHYLIEFERLGPAA